MIIIQPKIPAPTVSVEGFAKSILSCVDSGDGAAGCTQLALSRTWLYRRFGPRLTRARDLHGLLDQIDHDVCDVTGRIMFFMADLRKIVEEAKAKKAVARGNRRGKQQRGESVSG